MMVPRWNMFWNRMMNNKGFPTFSPSTYTTATNPQLLSTKVDVCYSKSFIFKPTSRRTWTPHQMWDDQHIQIVAVAIRLILLRTPCMNVLIIKMNILQLIKWSHRSSQPCPTIEPRMHSIFWTQSSISFKHMSYLRQFLDPHLLTTYRLNTTLQIILAFNLSISILPYT